MVIINRAPRLRPNLALASHWLVCFIALLAALVTSRGAPPEGLPAGFPELRLPEKTSGESAILALGNKLGAVAAFYRLTEDQLRERLRQQKSLRVDEYGRLFYVCVWPSPPADSEPEVPTPFVNSPAGYPYEHTFLLHSRPSSTKKIFLDFDGHDASTTSWGNDAVGRPFDLDGDPSTFSTTERDRIQYIWLRVAEDFALYDVDVTTQEPGVEALRMINAGDLEFGIRVVIGGSSSDWFGSAGGVAYLRSFNWNSDTPCWVWPGSLSNSEKNIAEAASHEVGHTLGLNHDGQRATGILTNEYYGGHGNWAPIMGVGYSRPISQWSKGEYIYANNFEDDLTFMLTYGVAYRPDDHGGSIGAATATTGVLFSVPGNIERTTDVDFFSFKTGAGRIVLTASPAPRGPNLRIQLSLFNSSGALITSTNVADTSSGTLPATLTAIVPIGTYYASIDGIGSLNAFTNGYSDYASIGQYTLSGTLPSDSGWIATLAGTDYSWTNPANWASGSIPIGVNGVARINNNILGDQTISLDIPVSIGRLHLGDADGLHSFTIQAGTGGPLTFASTTNQAFLIKTTGSFDTISTPILLQTNLTVTNTTANMLVLAGDIGGAGSLVKMGSGPLMLSGSNSYTGTTIVGEGTLLLTPPASLSASTGIDIRSGAVANVTSLGAFLLEEPSF